MAYDEVGAGDVVSAETINYVIQRAINRPVTRLVLPANQSITTATPTTVLFGSSSETNDDLSWHSTSVNTSRITPTYPGRYLVLAWASFATNTTGDRRLSINKNGITYAAHNAMVGLAGRATPVRVQDVIEADGVTDYFEISVYQNSGGNLNLLGASDAADSTGFVVSYWGDDT